MRIKHARQRTTIRCDSKQATRVYSICSATFSLGNPGSDANIGNNATRHLLGGLAAAAHVDFPQMYFFSSLMLIVDT